LHVTFGLTVEKLWGFEDFSPSLGMLSATVNAGNSAQICPKLPKTAKICQNLPEDETLKFHQKSRFKCVSKKKNLCVEEALEHVSTVWIFNPRIFHMLFLLSKNGLCM
jgi:hypothetical protein